MCAAAEIALVWLKTLNQDARPRTCMDTDCCSDFISETVATWAIPAEKPKTQHNKTQYNRAESVSSYLEALRASSRCRVFSSLVNALHKTEISNSCSGKQVKRADIKIAASLIVVKTVDPPKQCGGTDHSRGIWANHTC